MSNTPTSSAQVAEGMNLEAERAAFEAYIGWNAGCQFRNADGSYQVSDLQHAWEIWQAARRSAPVAEGVALPPLDAEGLPPLSEPAVFDVKRSIFSPPTAYTAEQVRGAQREAIAPYAERIRQLERELENWKESNRLLAASRDRWKDAAGAAS